MLKLNLLFLYRYRLIPAKPFAMLSYSPESALILFFLTAGSLLLQQKIKNKIIIINKNFLFIITPIKIKYQIKKDDSAMLITYSTKKKTMPSIMPTKTIEPIKVIPSSRAINFPAEMPQVVLYGSSPGNS
jgi:hypothetical protein